MPIPAKSLWVVRQLSEAAGLLQYQIKSEMDATAG